MMLSIIFHEVRDATMNELTGSFFIGEIKFVATSMKNGATDDNWA